MVHTRLRFGQALISCLVSALDGAKLFQSEGGGTSDGYRYGTKHLANAEGDAYVDSVGV